MFTYVYEKYVNNFKTILPFIFMKVGSDLLKYFKGNKTNVLENYDMVFGLSKVMESLGLSGILISIFLILIGPVIYLFIALTSKKILRDEEEINPKEILRETVHYYFRYVGLSLMIGVIVIGISLLMLLTGGFFILFIPVIIFLLYFIVTVEPCIEYLVYNDSSVEDGFSEGRKLGKKYFWNLVVLDIIIIVLNQIFRISFFATLPGILIMSFFTAFFQGYTIMFRMNLCTLVD